MSPDRKLVPITSADELAALADASKLKGKYGDSAEHIRTASGLFGQRPTPDFDNCCKEAASALEAALRIATGESKMGDATRSFAKTYGVHPALMESASNMFGYASDRDGVRHGSKGTGKPVDFDEAKMVLVTASAWVNFIAAKAP